jgi:apolipoprotein N-acyltransferase
MNCRRHGSKSTIALWMLIAVADVAILAAAAGPLIVLLIIAGLVLLAGAVLGMRMLTRRDAVQTQSPTRSMAEAMVRRRA